MSDSRKIGSKMKAAEVPAHRIVRAARLAAENIRQGTFREAVLKRALLAVMRGQSRQHWANGAEQHYFVHRPQLAGIALGEASGEALYAYTRAFLAAEVIRPGAVVLDIGCGDGSLTKRFYAPRAAHVDAIDLEDSAIGYARRYNAAPNIVFQKLDAVLQPFPRADYDVIVFDGAIGHFSRNGSIEVLKKISGALKPEGVFCGSESLGVDGDDHLQYFMTYDDFRSILLPAFRFVRIKSQKYRLSGSFERHEAYWRASNSDVLGQWEWQ